MELPFLLQPRLSYKESGVAVNVTWEGVAPFFSASDGYKGACNENMVPHVM